jgi:hypothetical protein
LRCVPPLSFGAFFLSTFISSCGFGFICARPHSPELVCRSPKAVTCLALWTALAPAVSVTCIAALSDLHAPEEEMTKNLWKRRTEQGPFRSVLAMRACWRKE